MMDHGAERRARMLTEAAELTLEAASAVQRQALAADSIEAKVKLAKLFEQLAKEARETIALAAAEARRAAGARRERERRYAEQLRTTPPAGSA